MARRLKLLSGLSTLAFSGALALTACGGKGEGEGAEGEDTRSVLAGAQGEGGTSESEVALVAGADKSVYLSQLMILRGHLKAGTMLYAAGEGSLAAAHMKHPHDEIFMTLQPMLTAYGATGLDSAVEALAASVADGMPVEKSEEAFAGVRNAVSDASASATPTLTESLLAASLTLRQAGLEFDEGVKNGVVVNLKEYQDAYGFIATVVEILATVEGDTEAEKAAVAAAREQAAIAFSAAPSVMPAAGVSAGSSPIYGAAARIELAALALD